MCSRRRNQAKQNLGRAVRVGSFRRLDRKLVTMYPHALGRAHLGLVGHPFEEPGVRVVPDGDFERDEEAPLGEGGEERGAATEDGEANPYALEVNQGW